MILDIAEKKRKLFDLISAIHKLTAIPQSRQEKKMMTCRKSNMKDWMEVNAKL